MSNPGWYSPPYFDGHTWGAINGIRVLERRDLLSGTRRTFLLRHSANADPTIACWSMAILRILMAPELSGVTFAAWHDDSLNCATWTDAGCRCEVDP
jgi:hypothetical protein